MSMMLIQKGKRAKVICVACKALHAAKDCPARKAANRHAQAFYRQALALQSEIQERRKVCKESIRVSA